MTRTTLSKIAEAFRTNRIMENTTLKDGDEEHMDDENQVNETEIKCDKEMKQPYLDLHDKDTPLEEKDESTDSNGEATPHSDCPELDSEDGSEETVADMHNTPDVQEADDEVTGSGAPAENESEEMDTEEDIEKEHGNEPGLESVPYETDSHGGGQTSSDPAILDISEELRKVNEYIERLNETATMLSQQFALLSTKTDERMMSRETCLHFDRTIKEQLDRIKLSLTRDILMELIQNHDDIIRYHSDAVKKKEELSVEGLLLYIEQYSRAIGRMLCDHGVEMTAVEVGDMFDNKKQKNIGIVPTDDQSLNMTVESVYSDCYTLEGKVIYPAQVKVYKSNKIIPQTNEGISNE